MTNKATPRPPQRDPKTQKLEDLAYISYGADGAAVDRLSQGSFLVFAELLDNPGRARWTQLADKKDGLLSNGQQVRRVVELANALPHCKRVRVLACEEIPTHCVPKSLRCPQAAAGRAAAQAVATQTGKHLCSCPLTTIQRHGCQCGGV